MLYATEKRRAVTAILLVFMFIFAELLVAENNHSELEVPNDNHVLTQSSIIAETYVSSQSPNVNYFSSSHNLVGDDGLGHQQLSMYRFSNTLNPLFDSVQSAELTLTCDIISQEQSGILPKIYAATIIANIAPSEVTWNEIASSIPWQQPGLNGPNDRDVWDVPSDNQLISSNTYEYTLNVTKLAQNSLDLNRNNFDFVLSTKGGELQCAKTTNTTANFQPSLWITSSSFVHGDGGLAISNFAVDGMPLMTNSLIPTPDTNPTISYELKSGENVEFQFSLSNDFRNSSDLTWIYSSISHAFVIAGSNGSFTIPSTDTLPVTKVINYRYRSIDSTSKISDWTNGNFLLPNFVATTNNNGTVTISLQEDDFALEGYQLLDDTYVDSSSLTPKGSLQDLVISNEPTSRSISHIQVNTHLLGLKSNATILSAELELQKTSISNSEPTLSLHEYSGAAWNSNEATWNFGSIGSSWSDGGLDSIQSAEQTNIEPSGGTNQYSINIQDTVQSSLNNNYSDGIRYVLTGYIPGDANPASSEEISFASNDYQIPSGQQDIRPKLMVTFALSGNSTTEGATLKSPVNGQPVWEITNNNLSGDSTPTLSIESSSNLPFDYFIEISTDKFFRNLTYVNDSIGQTLVQSNNYNFTLGGIDSLAKGSVYYWRVKTLDNDGRVSEWNNSHFFISTIDSEWLGGDNFRFVINSSLEPNSDEIPNFTFSSITSNSPNTNTYGYPYLISSNLPSQGTTKSLLGLDLENYMLPQGYAVISSNLTLVSSAITGSPEIGVWELENHDWNEQEVTWMDYSENKPWDSPGASGTNDRVALIDSQIISTTGSSTWNITSSVQSSMREGGSLDLLLETAPGQSSVSAQFYSHRSTVPSQQPQIEIIFTLGSNQLPQPPSAVSPFNGEWVFQNNSTLESNDLPELEWSPNTQSQIIGWALEIDTSNTFDSSERIAVSSWNDLGFDIQNCTYELQNPLTDGQKWFWRIRGLTSTFQLGDWSSSFEFYIADLNYNLVSPNQFTTEYSQGSAFTNYDSLIFQDVSLVDSPTIPQMILNDPLIDVGKTNSGFNSSILINIPLPSEIQPNNASLISANLTMDSTSLSTIGIPLAVREVYVPWTENANSQKYNSTNNWSVIGGRGIGTDISSPIDIQQSIVGKMSWNITHILQNALALGKTTIPLMIYANANNGEMVYFSSSDSFTDQPLVNFTWEFGSNIVPTDIPESVSPQPSQIYFNTNSHAILPSLRPTFEWSIPTISSVPDYDSWRVFFDNDINDDMAGTLTFDSRVQPELFDVTNLTFDPDVDINMGNTIQWYVQGIKDNMLGNFSNKSTYFIPNLVGQEITPTDAFIAIQDGTIYEPTNFPMATTDTYLDEGLPYNQNNGNGLYVGNSTTANTNTSSTTSLIEFNLSKLPLPTDIEILNATLVMNAISGAGEVDVSASRMLTNWDSNSTWVNSSNGTAWNNPGSLRGADSDLPDSLVTVSSDGVYNWNVTRILQLAIDSGDDIASIILQPEIIYAQNGIIEGNYYFADSENSNLNLRPKLELYYRVGHQWLAPSPTHTSPQDNSTLWDESTANLSTPSSIEFGLSSTTSNVTDWNLCYGKEIRWLNCMSSLNMGSDFSWNPTLNEFELVNASKISSESGDEWQYWRIRGDQNHRIGHYSSIQKYRVPSNQSTFDGLENYSVEFSRASIFDSTGDLPRVSDVESDSQNLVNIGGLNILNLGFNQNTGGDSEIYLDFNLTDIFFSPNTTPTKMLLELDIATPLLSNNPMTVAVYSCGDFDEYTLTATNTPTCSTVEITRTTISGLSSNLVTWDITGLAQNNLITANQSFTLKLSLVSGFTNSVGFYSSEAQSNSQPTINLTYVDNIGGLTPPSQPNLISPADGDILYNLSSDIVQSPQFVELSWSPVVDATDYKLFIKDEINLMTIDSRYNSGIVGTTYNTSSLVEGSVYEWWVQPFNQSIPGASTPRWSFGLGSPNHVYNYDGTYTYQVIDSAEIEAYSHVDVKDTMIVDALPMANYGQTTNMMIGGGCFNTQNSICDAIISLDLSDIELNDQSQSIHSVDLTLYVDYWDLSGGAYEIDFSVHQFLISNWNEQTIAWNTTGTNPGPIAGIDYNSLPIDVQTFSITDDELKFQIATDNLLVDDEILLFIRGEPISSTGTYDGFVQIHSSEALEEKFRPKFEIHHTNVSSLNISTSSTSFDADGAYNFNLQGYDSNGVLIPNAMPNGAQVEWFTTSGSIITTGSYSVELSPSINGLQTLTACFGVICTDYLIDIESGIPVQIFASLSQTSDVNSITMTADETVSVSAYAVDQHGNLVTNEIINFLVSNGTISSSNLFYPYTVGNQTITAEWVGATTSLQEVLQVEVTPGAPTEVTVSGCDQIISANTSCFLYGSAYDQFGNTVWFDDVVSFEIDSEDGETLEMAILTPHDAPPQEEVLVGEFTGNFVGIWEVTLSTEFNLLSSIFVDVTHGEIASFELTSSNETITADEFLFIDSTRIDVRGNTLAVVIPVENWTSLADGTITPGLTSTWEPSLQGSKSITASYEGFSDTIEVFVLRGVLYDLQVLVNEEVSNEETFAITADDQITANLRAFDAKGNQWLVDGEWSIYHPNFMDQSLLSSNFSQEVTFSPISASNSPYAINIIHQENDIVLSSNLIVYVSVGDIENFIVSASDSNGNDYSVEDGFSLTADDYIQFQMSFSDYDLNPIEDADEIWLLENLV
ncbi:MAG: DNRLRE domain-containing protein, partial [Candidatus Poseidoniaceae archaeon]